MSRMPEAELEEDAGSSIILYDAASAIDSIRSQVFLSLSLSLLCSRFKHHSSSHKHG